VTDDAAANPQTITNNAASLVALMMLSPEVFIEYQRTDHSQAYQQDVIQCDFDHGSGID
jgi:hypothetical protein